MESDSDSEYSSREDNLGYNVDSDLEEQVDNDCDTNEMEQSRKTGKKSLKKEHVEQSDSEQEEDVEETDEEDGGEDEDVSDGDSADDMTDKKTDKDKLDSDTNDDDPRFQFGSDKDKSRLESDTNVDEDDDDGLRFKAESDKTKMSENTKSSKPGIIYLSRIPPLMKPKKLSIIFNQYGEVGRIFFQQEDKNFRKQRKKRGGNRARAYTEGWIEFKKKKIAKRVALTFNNTRIGVKKRSRYYDDLWNMKYLPRFHWAHLMERIEYEKQVRSQRVRTEVMQAKKETSFYMKNVEQQKVIERMQTKKRKKEWEFTGRNFKQWKTEEERADDRRMLQEALPQRSGKVTTSVLDKIFKK